jgi:hypothetical protein
MWRGFACLAGLAVLTAAAPAQRPEVPERDPVEAGLLEWVRYIEPFVYVPWQQLRPPAVLPSPDPLFQPYDPLQGLDAFTSVSRAVNPRRAVVYLPVVEAKVGDVVEVPLMLEQPGIITAVVIHLRYDPDVVELVDARPIDWPDVYFVDNPTPDEGQRQFRVKVASAFPTPVTRPGPLVRFRFRVTNPGEARLLSEQFSMSDAPYFNTVPTVVRTGLIRARG